MSRFDFRCAALPDSVRVIGFRGHEGISLLYRFELHLEVPDGDCADLDLDACMGARGTLTLKPEDTDERELHYHGILSQLEILQAVDGTAILACELVPALAKLAYSQHTRVFTGDKVGDIIEAVIGAYELDHEIDVQLSGDHPDEEHVCQYRESDMVFLSRWMEREGIFYFFDHSGDSVEKLVIADSESIHAPCQDTAVRYVPVSGGADASAGQALHRLREQSAVVAGSVTVRDYDHGNPSADVSSEQAGSSTGAGAVVLHELRTFDPSDAKRLAALFAEQIKAEESRVHGEGLVFGLRPGFTFELSEHARTAMNQVYLVVETRHVGAQSFRDAALRRLLGYDGADGYHIEINLLASSTPFRCASRTAWPRIHGYQLGVVAGPAESDYAQLDDQGRYLVKLLFDESDLSGSNVSTRIRMMQPHAGDPEGWHLPLRAGTEVVVAFVGGDPDRPVIAGAVPNAHNPSVVTSSNHTQNWLQTGGKTRIEVEDEKGKQHVYIYTPPEETYLHMGEPFNPTHNIVLHTNKDCLFQIGTDQKIEVGGELDEQVTGDVTEKYHDKRELKVTGPKETEVTNAVEERYLGTQTTTVNGLRDENFNKGQKTTVTGFRDEKYHVGQTTTVTGTTDEIFDAKYTRKVTGGHTVETYSTSLTENITGACKETFPAVFETYGDVDAEWASFKWTAGPIEITAPNWNVTTPNKSQLCADKFAIDFLLTEVASQSIGTTVMKIETVPVLASEAFGVKIGLGGLVMGITAGPSLAVGIGWWEFEPYDTNLGGLFIYS